MNVLLLRNLSLGALVCIAGCASSGVPSGEDGDTSDAEPHLAVTRGGVQVFRDGRVIATGAPYPLRDGDEIATDSDGEAVVHFPEGGILVRSDTRVRVGSLEVLFGEVFAALRNLFTVSSENVVASVEGTSFSFETSPLGPTRISVEEGLVVCRSKKERWSPIPIRAGRSLLFPGKARNAPPRVEPADREKLRKLRRWTQQLLRRGQPERAP